MKLREYMDIGEIKPTQLASKLGIAPAYLYQMAAGIRAVSAERCIQIEKATAGAVRCEDLRPDVDWAYLRGKAVIVMATGSDIETAAAGQGV